MNERKEIISLSIITQVNHVYRSEFRLQAAVAESSRFTYERKHYRVSVPPTSACFSKSDRYSPH
ncbi:MAG: hypothetical protein ACOCZS_04840, partial [Verrucomicrobiota bacterium]